MAVLVPHICWNCTLISLNVSVMTAMKTFLTSHERKKIMVLKKKVARQLGRASIVLYMTSTQPSCDAAWYTVNILVAGNGKKIIELK